MFLQKIAVKVLLACVVCAGISVNAASQTENQNKPNVFAKKSRKIKNKRSHKTPRTNAKSQTTLKNAGVGYVPTPPETVAEMLRLAEIKEGDVLYDLGSGDGRIPIEAAKNIRHSRRRSRNRREAR